MVDTQAIVTQRSGHGERFKRLALRGIRPDAPFDHVFGTPHPEIEAHGLTGVSVPMMLKALTYKELAPAALVEKLADTVSPSCAPMTAAG